MLRLSGGSGTVAEVIDSVIERMKIPESEQAVTLNPGQSRIRNQVQWARLYLVRAAYLDASRRGIWSLTEKGLTEDLSRFDVLATFKKVQKIFQEEKKQETNEGTLVDEADEMDIEPSDYRTELLNLLKLLPPSGFERLCPRLLRESGSNR